MSTKQSRVKRIAGFIAILLLFSLAFASVGIFKAMAQEVQHPAEFAQAETHGEAGLPTSPEHNKWAFISAAIAVSIGSISGAAAVGYVGASAMGAMSEKPELFARALVFVALAEGIAVYGLIIALQIVGKVRI